MISPLAMAVPSRNGSLRIVPEISVDTVTIDFGCVTPLARTDRRTALFSTVTAETLGISPPAGAALSGFAAMAASGATSDAGLVN